jgi:macrodomain Ter protein organizer (MatP/YcbG family)
MKELSDDVVEMIEDASPEEKKYLANRISSLAQKVSRLEHDD